MGSFFDAASDGNITSFLQIEHRLIDVDAAFCVLMQLEDLFQDAGMSICFFCLLLRGIDSCSDSTSPLHQCCPSGGQWLILLGTSIFAGLSDCLWVFSSWVILKFYTQSLAHDWQWKFEIRVFFLKDGLPSQTDK